MPRAGVTIQRITDEALLIADERGLEQVTLAAIAERLGVRVPSLYKHVGGLSEVQDLLAEASRIELAGAMEQATVGRSGPQAIASLASAVRLWALAHPGRYASTVTGHRPGTEPGPGMQRATTVFLRIVANGQADTSDDVVTRARALRSAIHGFVDLELRGGFGLPTNVEDSFRWLVEGLGTLIGATTDEG